MNIRKILEKKLTLNNLILIHSIKQISPLSILDRYK